MRKSLMLLTLILIGLLTLATTEASDRGVRAAADFQSGKPALQSMSALAFGPDGILFVGDSKAGAVFAIETGDTEASAEDANIRILDVEKVIADMLGTTASEIMIHDLAVNPISQSVYLAVSRGRGKWQSSWYLPNDLADAQILLRVAASGEITEVDLGSVRYASAELANPVAPGTKHRWKEGADLRTDAITDLAFRNGTLYVAGLSNEEFSSTMWRIPFPFAGGASATTLEIFHGAHGEYETHAPIRTFVPYELQGQEHILAAYLCTPFVTFKTADLQDGAHVKGRTLGEFGSGNYPLDMVVYQKNGEERLLIANSNLPLMIVKPTDIAAWEEEITEEPETYAAGLPYEVRSGAGIQQLDRLNASALIGLQRLPGGTLALVSVPAERF